VHSLIEFYICALQIRRPQPLSRNAAILQAGIEVARDRPTGSGLAGERLALPFLHTLKQDLPLLEFWKPSKMLGEESLWAGLWARLPAFATSEVPEAQKNLEEKGRMASTLQRTMDHGS